LNNGRAFSTVEIWKKFYGSALLFLQWRIGFIRRRLGFGALGFAQRSSLVLLSSFSPRSEYVPISPARRDLVRNLA
jgi:hypothetical protein